MTGTRIVVIGSGFGGAIPAARLAEAGFEVILLERGPWRDSVPVRSIGIRSRAPLPTGRHLVGGFLRSIRTPRGRVTLNKRGFLEVYLSKGLKILSASNVGGGSHAYLGLHMRPPEPGYWDAAGLSDTGMERHYETLMERMGTTVPGPAHRRNSIGKLVERSSVLSTDDVAAALPMGLRLPDEPDSPQLISNDGLSRMEAAPGRDGTFGSPGGGKTTLDAAYLYAAMRDHGLQVHDLTEAVLVRPAGPAAAGRWRVTARNLRSGRVRDHFADHVFVAAGTVGTLDLLLRSRQAQHGLTGMPRLGEKFFANGDLAFTCRLPDRRMTRPSIAVDGAVRCVDGIRPLGERAWPLLIVSTLPTGDLPLPKFLKRRLRRDVIIAGMGKDRGGRVRLVGNRLVVEYEPDTNPIYRDVAEAVAIVAAELGTTVSKPGTPTTAHPMGGACLADSPDRGVVNLGGEVFGHPGLYVTDAAALPQPVGGPPSLTIGAWAEHVAERFIEKNAPADRRGVPVGKKSIPTQTAMDGWWGRHVVTRVVRDGCRRPALMSARDELLAHAHGAVFELGCGDGINIPLLDEPRITSYTAIDPSDELLLRARDVAAGHRIPADIRWGVGEDVPFPDASFDTVITSYALCSVRSPHEVLREMRRILRPDGVVLYLEHGLAPDRAVRRWQRRVDPISTRLLGNCHMSRSISDSFGHAGFTVERLGAAYADGLPRFAGWLEWGVARPAPKVEPEEREGTGQPQLRDLGLRAEP
ncbi:methyltransferase domain-containing protein [Mycolicibacterium pyrenivorans]|uniref:methyltransferase domain-containing protein n=1 Tax=Mycolicibacterium pyrenivorans TaxID=187102 RepID=UPI0021F2E0A7|nr:methyltransferase domain-containing protein [Mycolicibacterium pyrenivorans]MCV7152692.1 methyltransferase domain-containing protein [Mycolicibacterium pyrenivorans]